MFMSDGLPIDISSAQEKILKNNDIGLWQQSNALQT
jgi:hypothetical protein